MMRLTLTATAMALALGLAGTANAQQAAEQKPPEMCPSEFGKKARDALATYNEAVAAGDAAKIATAKAAAQAAVKTDAERCVLAQIAFNQAAKANDNAGMAAEIQALASNPAANPSLVSPLMLNLAKIKFNAKDYAGAGAVLDKIIASGKAGGEAYIMQAEVNANTGKAAQAPAMAAKALAAERAAGKKPPESWYKHAVSWALDVKSPEVVDISRNWVSDYPTPDNWHDALRILATTSPLSENDLIDVYRLQMATKGLSGSGDYGRYANLAQKLGYPGETKAAIEAGIAANALSASSGDVGPMLQTAKSKTVSDKASLDASTAKALAAGNAKVAMNYGDANYGYGNYAKAADVYRAVAGMSGADVATAKLRLGMALAMAGDKAGAATALNSVTGPKADLAKYWLSYAQAR